MKLIRNILFVLTLLSIPIVITISLLTNTWYSPIITLILFIGYTIKERQYKTKLKQDSWEVISEQEVDDILTFNKLKNKTK